MRCHSWLCFAIKIVLCAASSGKNLSIIISCLAVLAVAPLSAAEIDVRIHYLEQTIDRPPSRSQLIVWPEDDGLQGAALAVADNNTTGKFLKHQYELEQTIVDNHADLMAAAKAILDRGAVMLLLNVPAEAVMQISDLPEAADDLLFNARSTRNSLRSQDCRTNVLHTIASRAMLSDALMQFLTKRRWNRLFLVEGSRAGDTLYARSLRNSAKKFGLKLVEEKIWLDDADIRRNASLEVPAFTRHKNYDAIVVADEDQDFAHYLLYNTWLPRPITGSAGLSPVIWSPVIEQWGALQLQSRFTKLASRDMTGVDYANWAAVRTIGEAVTRTQSNDVSALRDYILSDQFELAGFKGHSLSYRDWNGQLRQSVPLVHAHAVAANAPIEGYLHHLTELDTLGLDRPESDCTVF